MSILNRPLTEQELAAAGIEPAPIAHETFTQLFAVDRGQLEILDAFSTPLADGEQDEEYEDTPPKFASVTPAVWGWAITMGAAAGALFYAAGGGQ